VHYRSPIGLIRVELGINSIRRCSCPYARASNRAAHLARAGILMNPLS
jgi:hypothetical protein